MPFDQTNESTNPLHPDDNTAYIFAAAVRRNGTDRKSNVITITQMLGAMCVHLFLPPDSGILF